MSEVETLREAAEILRRETGYVVDSVVMRDLADRLERPDPDEGLAKAMIAAANDERGRKTWAAWADLPEDSRRGHLAAARAARAHIAAESAEESAEPAPAPEPWSPTPGQWAQIKPGADRGDVPKSVRRVLVLELIGLTERTITAAWSGPTLKDGTTWGYIAPSSLAPVQPRVWDRAEDVPVHVVVRNRTGNVAWRDASGVLTAEGLAPFTEVLPEDGAL